MSEMKALSEEETSIYGILKNSKEEILKKEQGIRELQKEVLSCQEKEDSASAQMEIWQKDKEERNASHKAFLRSGMSFPGASACWIRNSSD